MVGLLAVAALLCVGAAGLSGHLVGEDHCPFGAEGSSVSYETRWAPPGFECAVHGPADDASVVGERTGSWPGFIGALVVGFGVVGLALRRRADAPTWLRLSAVTTLGFAVAGVGAFYGGWQGSVLVTIYGLPVAFAADRWLLRDSGGDRPWTAGLEGAAVAFTAVVVASAGYLFGLGLAGYGLTLLLVTAAAALPWRRLAPPHVASP